MPQRHFLAKTQRSMEDTGLSRCDLQLCQLMKISWSYTTDYDHHAQLEEKSVLPQVILIKNLPENNLTN